MKSSRRTSSRRAAILTADFVAATTRVLAILFALVAFVGSASADVGSCSIVSKGATTATIAVEIDDKWKLVSGGKPVYKVTWSKSPLGGSPTYRQDTDNSPITVDNLTPGAWHLVTVRARTKPKKGWIRITRYRKACSITVKAEEFDRTCCCGNNILYADTPFPHLSWAIKQNGHFSRMWWDQTNHEEQVDYTSSDAPLVPGTLHRDPFGDGAVALNERGEIVVTVKENGRWTTDLILPRVLQNEGWARPCRLFSTTGGDFKGVWAVAGDKMLRFFQDGGTWQHSSVALSGHGERVAPSSLYESHNGQVAGLLDNGQQWVIWHKDGDPRQMRFDYGAGKGIVVPPTPTCEKPVPTP